jgi:hypothetical protein
MHSGVRTELCLGRKLSQGAAGMTAGKSACHNTSSCVECPAVLNTVRAARTCGPGVQQRGEGEEGRSHPSLLLAATNPQRGLHG